MLAPLQPTCKGKSCVLPILDSLTMIHSTNIAEIAALSLVDTKGTPRYLIGRVPSLHPNKLANCGFRSSSTPHKNTLLLVTLGTRPDRSSNMDSTSFTALTDFISPLQNTIRSSAKHTCDNLIFSHLQWYLKPGKAALLLIRPENTSMANTKR